ncbi:unnamed protein product [Lactuca virosa]|uniref:Uncharacterized protein n=1 Tax=Lactuca virosa TaxID=75947 RepID=A0AAU9MKN0_9ASTR|nr:unnamed protein product [Lactuca virosa]
MDATTVMPTPTVAIQHVTKASSNEILKKFIELASPDRPSKKSSRLSKRQKIYAQSLTLITCESSEFIGTLVIQRKSLLPPILSGHRSSGTRKLISHIKVGRAQLRSRNRSVFETIEKTWQRTLDGAPKMLKEKQYNRHKRLLSDTT